MQVQRALPMLALLGVRAASLLTRAALNSGSQTAIKHFAVLEVFSCPLNNRRCAWASIVPLVLMVTAADECMAAL